MHEARQLQIFECSAIYVKVSDYSLLHIDYTELLLGSASRNANSRYLSEVSSEFERFWRVLITYYPSWISLILCRQCTYSTRTLIETFSCFFFLLSFEGLEFRWNSANAEREIAIKMRRERAVSSELKDSACYCYARNNCSQLHSKPDDRQTESERQRERRRRLWDMERTKPRMRVYTYVGARFWSKIFLLTDIVENFWICNALLPRVL